MGTYSGDRSSAARKRALRRLAYEERAVYREMYEQARRDASTHDQARGRGRTLLRYRFPDRYLELYAEEQAAPGTDVPPGIRSKAWLKANAALADLRTDTYRPLFEQARADGLNNSCAYDLASSQLRTANQELFVRLLAEEIRSCLQESGVLDSPAACPECAGTSFRRARRACAQPCGRLHLRCVSCGATAGDCYRATVTAMVKLLTGHRPTIMAAFLDAIVSRRPLECCPACNGQPCPRHAADLDLADQYQSVAEALQGHLTAITEHQHGTGRSAVHRASGIPPGPADAAVRVLVLAGQETG